MVVCVCVCECVCASDSDRLVFFFCLLLSSFVFLCLFRLQWQRQNHDHVRGEIIDPYVRLTMFGLRGDNKQVRAGSPDLLSRLSPPSSTRFTHRRSSLAFLFFFFLSCCHSSSCFVLLRVTLCVQSKTSVVQNNGFNPRWSEGDIMEFDLSFPGATCISQTQRHRHMQRGREREVERESVCVETYCCAHAVFRGLFFPDLRSPHCVFALSCRCVDGVFPSV